MTLIPTHGLRWSAGVLEQRFLRTNGSTVVWLPVPKENTITGEAKDPMPDPEFPTIIRLQSDYSGHE